jgi:gliding motility-associated-like protein
LQGFGSPVSYNPPFAGDRPMPWTGNANGVFPTGIHCDPLNGDIMFTPPNSGGLFTGIMAIEIKQWKLINGVMTVVGITRRDIQMVVRGDCLPNNPPRLITDPPEDGNVNVPKTNWSICAGDQLCFTVTAKDTDFNPPTISDTTYLSWNASLAAYGATFKPDYDPAKRQLPDSLGGGPREDRYRFCWTPDESKASTTPYYFTVSAKDKRCPNPGRLTRSFSILVIGKANLQINKSNLKCGKWGFSYTNLTPKFVPTVTQWQISRVPGDQSMSQNPYTYNNTSSPGSIQFTQGGRYYILLKAVTPGPIGSLGCEKFITDSFDVDSVMLVQKRDTVACMGSSVVITASAKHGIPSFSYRWFNSIKDTATAPLNSNVTTANFSVSTPVTRYYTIQIKDLNGCKAYDSLKVEAKNLPVGLLPVSSRICNEDTMVLDPGRNGGNIKSYLWNVGDTTQTIAKRDSGQYIVVLTDTFNCKQTDTTMLYVNQKVIADLGPDKAICEGSSVTLKATGGQLYQWRNLTTNALVQAKGYSDTLKVTPTNVFLPTRYEVKVFSSYPDTAAKFKECFNTDTISVKVNALPKLKRPGVTPSCFTEPTATLPSFLLDPSQSPSQGGVGSSGIWSYPSNPSALVVGGSTQVLINKLKNIPTKDSIGSFDNWIRFTFTGPPAMGGCSTTDSAIVRIYGTPPTNAGADLIRCDIAGVYEITKTHPYSPQNTLHLLEHWSGPGVDSQQVAGIWYFRFNPVKAGVQRLPAQNTLTYIYGKDYSDNDPVGLKCYKADQVLIGVTTAPTIGAGSDILVCADEAPFAITPKAGASIAPAIGTSPYWEAADSVLKNKGVLLSQSFSAAGAAGVLPIGQNSGNRSYVMYYKDTSTGCAVQASIKISIARVPKVDLSYEAVTDQPYVCENSKSVPFKFTSTNWNSATTSGEPTSNITYSVSPSSGAAAFGAGTFPRHAFNSNMAGPGSYWVKIKHTNNQQSGTALGLSFAGCSSSDSELVIVQAKPVIAVASPAGICSYEPIASVSLSQVPAAKYRYKWEVVGDGTYADEYANPGSYTPGPNDKLAAQAIIKAVSLRDTSLKDNGDQCAPVESTQTLNIYPAPQAVILPIDSEGCVPYTGNYAAGPTGVANADFNWSWNGQADPTKDSLISRYVNYYESGVDGKYSLELTVKAIYGTTECVATATPSQLTLHAVPKPEFIASPPTTTIAKPFFDFIDQSSSPDGSKMTYLWNLGPGPDSKKPGDRFVTVANPTNIEYAADTAWQKVWLYVTSEYGCIDSIMHKIRIEPDITIFIPNAFRPLGKDGNPTSMAPCQDGAPDCNKVFRVVANGQASVEVYIYNRWGQLVFNSTAPDAAWDGTVQNNGTDFCPQDVYVYQVNATSYNGKAYKYSGSITLLR